MSAPGDAALHEHPATGRSLLAAIRRLAALADSAAEQEEVCRGLAAELLALPGATEVIIHHLRTPGQDTDLVVVHVLQGDARLSWFAPTSARPAAVGWVAGSGESFLASGERQLRAGMPELLRAGATVGAALLLPITLQRSVVAVVTLVCGTVEGCLPQDVDDAQALVDQAATALALVRARAEAGTDAVTGCMNHRAMRRRLQEEIARAERTGGSLSCLLIDLDDFKLVNDRHGHQAGDLALREVAAGLMGEFRSFDRVARYGGDEFVVILPEADLGSAIRAGQRAASRLAGAQSARVAASIGVAQWHPPMTVDELLAACDAALLQAKREGKRRVTAAR